MKPIQTPTNLQGRTLTDDELRELRSTIGQVLSETGWGEVVITLQGFEITEIGVTVRRKYRTKRFISGCDDNVIDLTEAKTPKRLPLRALHFKNGNAP
jgi:hypothetical protein